MKNTGKLTILMIAVVALGIFALPSVMSVGTGQHTFNNGSAVDCNKCHGLTGDKVSTELAASGNAEFAFGPGKVPRGSTIQKIHSGSQCSDCHRGQTSIGPTGEHTQVNRQPLCASCHNYVLDLTGATTGELAGTSEPHSGFANSSLADRNAGCLGCHTAVTITGGAPSYSYGPAITALGLTIGNGPVVP